VPFSCVHAILPSSGRRSGAAVVDALETRDYGELLDKRRKDPNQVGRWGKVPAEVAPIALVEPGASPVMDGARSSVIGPRIRPRSSGPARGR
jgi:hypothetical protein